MADKMRDVWRGLREGLGNLWYAGEEGCILCGHGRAPLCPDCLNAYFCPQLDRCKNCGKLIRAKKIYCDDCAEGRGPSGLDKVTAWGAYAGAWKEFIWSLKFRAQPRRLEKLGYQFSEWVRGQLPPADGLVAVPMHPERLAERGFNQAEVIVSLLHREFGIPILDGLERALPTLSQVSLSRRDRLHNLQGAFTVKHGVDLRGKEIWLVDDVTTTGATLEECAKVLRAAGVAAVYAVCLAAGAEKTLVP